MKIISFSAGNFKRLTAIEITPTGDVITLAGDNGAGKSSILDGIEATVAGKDALPEKPIRDGAVKADTVVKLSNGMTLRRVYTASGSTLKITDSADVVQSSPQGLLDKLIGNLAFDPLEFSRLKGPEQRAILQKLVGLDFSAVDTERKKHYDERTEWNRTVDRNASQLAGEKQFNPLPEGVIIPDEETSAATVLAEIEAAEEQNRKASKAQVERCSADLGVSQAVDQIENAKKQIAEWQKLLTGWEVELEKAKHLAAVAKSVSETTLPVDLEPRREKLRQLDGQNQLVRKKKEQARLEKAVWEAKDEAKRRDVLIDEIDAKKQAALSAAKFPLPGLSFSEDGIFFNGQPWSQISDGEQLRISVAVGMALNPELRVIFIRNGSLLDSKGLALVAEMAEANQYQVWLEDARSTDPAAIVIEDGHVKNSDLTPAGTDAK